MMRNRKLRAKHSFESDLGHRHMAQQDISQVEVNPFNNAKRAVPAPEFGSFLSSTPSSLKVGETS